MTDTSFLMWNINMATQSQVFTLRALTNLLSMLKWDEPKAPVNKLSHCKAFNAQQVERWEHPRSTSIFLVATNRSSTLARA